MSKVKNKNSKPLYVKIIRYMWLAFILGLAGFVLFVVSVNANFLGLFGEMPEFESLENPDSELASELYSADGVLLGKYFRENRTPVTYNELSPNIINALIATEDVRFEDHSGIDPRALGRVFVKSILLMQKNAGGGSTLSQQTAKNLFKTRSGDSQGLLSKVPILNMVIIKTKEWIVATKLESAYTKDEILTMYLNTSDFGSNAFGIKTAAKTFFNKDTRDLNILESATLVGLLKAPSYYSPVYNAENSTRRRNTVMAQMKKVDLISQSQFDSLSATPMALEYQVESHNEGLATYFREVVKADLLQWTKENLQPDGSNYDLFGDGLKIYTTIDSRLQKYAEESVQEHMSELQKKFEEEMGDRDPWIDNRRRVIPNFIENAVKRTQAYRNLKARYGDNTDSIEYKLNEKKKMKVFSYEGNIDTLMSTMDSMRYYKKFLQTGFVSMDPHSGHIKAWVGGTNHSHFKYDHVKQGKRQPGSTFKPFVYAAAIENGYGPCYTVIDQPVEINVPNQPTWRPNNADGKFTYERMTIRSAMSQSVNSITAYMMKKLSPEVVVETAKRIGITSELEAVPALALGTVDVSIMEMVGAFSTFVNKGEHITPIYIDRIEDKNGNVLHQFIPRKRPAMSEEHAYIMVYMLRGGTEEEGGTSQGLPWSIRDEGNEIGGKTGTTQNASDGWYMGITKDLVSGVWVGGDDRAIHFRSWINGQGSRTARPIWSKYMSKVYEDTSLGITKGPFPKPERPISIEIDCSKYDLETEEYQEFDYDATSTDF
ncbi:penicillin-binding protein 1A [Cyclobacterium marinum]|uniref:penicillin-binding protein 1A n=1 Tax=Cyclobacterium marinum TaxID=104 RepID=UPI0011F0032C|nr:transglycosylase domain-containing protein [Cyclobacterium marinum]MBI0401609.1 transglycosylase domain-containing protein [Cyclobacterium marinum]|tara:strand:- start:59333 stop:61642 length:2310 start_codon:yes stop_codon:yes gene_type:complete